MLKSLFAVSAGLIGSAHAFWRMECPGRVGVARIDPIINPGEVSKHAHSIHGSSAFGETVSTEQLINGDCTSCRVTQDKSAYWHPSLYFQDANTGKYEIVPQTGGMLAYYLLYGDNITAFPTDFRMISGENTRRTYTAGDPSKPDPEKSLWESLGQTDQSTLAQRALGFNCLNYAKPPEGTLYRHYMPDKAYLDANCKNGLRFEIMFPSCWKGGNNIDSPDHKSHVAFPDLVMTGNCPKDYPYRLPSLMYEVIWDTASFANRNGKFVLSNGDTTGKLIRYSYHADFIMGWDHDFLQSAVNTCTSDTGLIEDCPLFNVVDQGTATSCEMKLPKALAKENVQGPMRQLPGSGAVNAPSVSVPAATSVRHGPSLTYAPGHKASNSASPLPGEVFKEKAVSGGVKPTTLTTARVAPTPSSAGVGILAASGPATTAPPAVNALDQSVSYYSTQYVTNGNIVSEIFWKQELVYVTKLDDITVTVTITSTAVPAAPTGKKRRRGLGHGHDQRHQ
ncbi:hypothetical protein BGZ63DRAFT_404401 [Mariannaea sp. PMI_226]|nr:hypothetical protein BGZ63DRAFT_404401 [Mariannaea sp. PMI_226]